MKNKVICKKCGSENLKRIPAYDNVFFKAIKCFDCSETFLYEEGYFKITWGDVIQVIINCPNFGSRKSPHECIACIRHLGRIKKWDFSSCCSGSILCGVMTPHIDKKNS